MGTVSQPFFFFFSTKQQSPSYPRNQNRHWVTKSTVSVVNPETHSLQLPKQGQTPETTPSLQDPENMVLLG